MACGQLVLTLETELTCESSTALDGLLVGFEKLLSVT